MILYRLMEVGCAHVALAALGAAFLYLVYVCHAMHRRQQRMEEYVMAAVRVGTVMAGGAAMGPVLQMARAAMGAAPGPPGGGGHHRRD